MDFMNIIRKLQNTLAAFLLLASCPIVIAQELEKPQGDVILKITGHISRTNENGAALFDMAMLEALPQTSFQTTTIWTEGKITFSGVSLHDLLIAVGSSGARLRTLALNDYAVEIPVSEAIEGGPIVATRADGAYMSVREKGPLWIVYPFDLQARYRSELTYSRSIWQLREIAVVD